MVSKRQLVVENERLKSELGYLRGRVEELERAPEKIVGHVQEIVGDTMRMFVGQPQAPMPDPYGETGELPADWTDHMAPKTVPTSLADLDDLETQLNDRLVIADELDRDP